MGDPTLEEVAAGWASWAADDIVSDLLIEGLINEPDVDEVHAVVVRHLTDIAVSNVIRATQRHSDG